jgi:hypothetical protein
LLILNSIIIDDDEIKTRRERENPSSEFSPKIRLLLAFYIVKHHHQYVPWWCCFHNNDGWDSENVFSLCVFVDLSGVALNPKNGRTESRECHWRAFPPSSVDSTAAAIALKLHFQGDALV